MKWPNFDQKMGTDQSVKIYFLENKHFGLHMQPIAFGGVKDKGQILNRRRSIGPNYVAKGVYFGSEQGDPGDHLIEGPEYEKWC